MLNVNELTSSLAKMSDPQLQQYARIHKDDPYTLALAAAESKRRSQLRAGGQQQAAQQPTVAEQALAQMGAPAPMPQQMQQPQQMQPQPQLPEDQGIGMLPAQNMAGMADGGIAGYADGGMVAFDNGGKVPSFDLRSGTPTVYGTNTADVFAPVAVEETSSPAGRFFSGLFAGPEGAKERYKTQQNKLARERALLDRLGQLEGLGFKQQTRAQQNEAANVRKELNNLRSTRVAETKPAAAPTTAPKPSAESPTTFESKLTAPTDGTRPGAGRVRTPGAGTTTKDGKAGTATAPDFIPSKPGDLTAELKRLQGMNPGTKAYDDLNAKIKQGFADLEKAREEGRPKDKAYTGLEALLGKEEEKAKGKEAKNFNMALINAGLAIAGGKSQYAIQNIAEGAQVGTKQYQEGLEKLEAAALERRKQSAMIEEARRAEARGDFKEAQQFKLKAFEAELGVSQAQIAAVQDLYKTDLKTASDIVNSQNALASADQRALMQEKGLSVRAREQNAVELQKAKIMASAYAGRGGDRGAITPALLFKEYNDNLQKDMMGDFKKQFPTFQHYMYANQPMSIAPVDKLPSDANVRK